MPIIKIELLTTENTVLLLQLSSC